MTSVYKLQVELKWNPQTLNLFQTELYITANSNI